MSIYLLRKQKLENASIKQVSSSCEIPKSLACLVCLSSNRKLLNLHEYKLAAMFGDLTGTPISVTDSLPQRVCLMCVALLRKAARFQMYCRRAQVTLLDVRNKFANTLTTENIIHKTCSNLPVQLTQTKPLIVEYPPNIATDYETVEEIFIQEDLSHVPYNTNVTDYEEINKIAKTEVDIEELGRISPTAERVKEVDAVNVPDCNVPADISANYSEDVESKYTSEESLGSDEFMIKHKQNKIKKNKKVSNKTHPKSKIIKTEVVSRSKRRKLAFKPKDIHIEIPQETCKKYFDQMTEFSTKYNMEMRILTDKEQMSKVVAKRESSRYKNARFKCIMCYRAFDKDDGLKHHLKTFHAAGSPISCDYCQYRFDSRKRLVQHHRNVHWREFVCRQCGHVTTSIQQVPKHFRLHSDPKVDHYKCPLCCKSFLQKASRARHLRSAHARSACHLCGDRFAPDQYVAHVQILHRKALDYRCDRCGLHFLGPEALHQHRAADFCGEELRSCGQCGDNLPTDELLASHLQEAHGRQCRRCDYTYVSIKAYRDHYYEVHKVRLHLKDAPTTLYERKPAQTLPVDTASLCDVCGMHIKRPTDLRKHLMVHSGERPHQCHLCAKRFRRDRDLLTHLKSHSDDRPFQCTECPSAFKLKPALARHQLIHADIRRYRCAVCARAFVQSSTLRAHVDAVHRRLPSSGAPRARRPARGRLCDTANNAKRTRLRTKAKESASAPQGDSGAEARAGRSAAEGYPGAGPVLSQTWA